jgi:NNMT/PNMT/TEMT family
MMKPLNFRWAGMFSGHPLSPTRRWMISAGATVASTYALDVIATTAGLLLVWSALFQEVDRDGALAFLAVSYVAWGAGLRINLTENWALLAATGTSTNVLSKAGFDLVRSRIHSQRAQRIAAAIGYVGTEFAKEAPYYIGAVGAAVFSDRVAANQVIVFLGGANLGAALYEYGLARLVRAFLARSRGAVSFEHDWQPRRYLAEYYRAVEADERQTIAFFVEAMTHVRCGEPVLLFGVGPTVHHVFLTAPKASEIHLTDYLPGNLAEVRRWLDADPGKHDWQPFVRYTLQCEGQTAPTQADVAAREAVTRRKTSRLIVADLRDPQPILTQYATVISAYCADSATSDLAEWTRYMHRIASMVRPSGTLLLAALRHSKGYRVGGKLFPSANISEHDVMKALQTYFCPENVTLRVCQLSKASKGYSGIILARSVDRRPNADVWPTARCGPDTPKARAAGCR